MSPILKDHDDFCTCGSTLHVSELQTFVSSWLSIFPKQNSFTFTSKPLSSPLSPFGLLILPCTQLAKLEISDSFRLSLHSHSPCAFTIVLRPAWQRLHWKEDGLKVRRSTTTTVLETARQLQYGPVLEKRQQLGLQPRWKKISLLVVLPPQRMGIGFCPVFPPPVLAG